MRTFMLLALLSVIKCSGSKPEPEVIPQTDVAAEVVPADVEEEAMADVEEPADVVIEPEATPDVEPADVTPAE